LISVNRDANELVVLTNHAAGTFLLASTNAIGGGSQNPVAADLNGNGKLDLLVPAFNDSNLLVLTNSGGGHFALAGTLPLGTGAFSAAVADVNNDGQPDLIATIFSAKALVVLTNNGNATFVPAVTNNLPARPVFVQAADLNSDGRVDLVNSYFNTNFYTVETNSLQGQAIRFNGVFAGDGAGLTNFHVSASDLTDGTVADARLSSNVALLGASQTFTGANVFGNAFNSFIGDGSGLTGLNAGNLVNGTLSDARLSANVALLNGNQVFAGSVQFSNASGTFSGTGSALTNVNATALNGFASSNFWQLGGNTGANPTNGASLGTVDNFPLEFKVNGQRALRLEPNTSGAPNIIGGPSLNFASPGVVGATIGGGGATNYFGLRYTNSVTADFGTVSGGARNTADSSATVGGGYNNAASRYSATVAGGAFNTASSNYATVSGGNFNIASNSYATVGGGDHNTASGIYATVVGGRDNTAGVSSTVGGGASNGADLGGTVAGGLQNTATNSYSTVSGGYGNRAANTYATVGGGTGNMADYSSTVGGGYGNSAGQYGTVAGGFGNSTSNSYAAVGGGEYNTAGGQYAIVGGGFSNRVGVFSSYATVGGGRNNTAFTDDSTISGGHSNMTLRTAATVGGGFGNIASGIYATVGGGYANIATNDYATVGGGYFNTANNNFATVCGGYNNIAGGLYSFAGGFNAQALHQGSFVWADSQGSPFLSAANDTFNIRAQGGVNLVTSGGGLSLDGQFRLNSSGGFSQSSLGNFSVDAPFAAGRRFTILSGGNVGIGTASPLTLLNVNGNARIEATNAPYNEGLAINLATDMTGGGYGGIAFHNAVRGAAFSSSTIKWGVFYNYTPELGITNDGLSFVQNNANTRIYISTNGNVGIGTLNTTNKLVVAGAVSATAYNGVSDRNAKENFATISPQEILNKVAALPITTWNFKELHDGRHMGPMAQDFYAAFGLGGSDTTITTVDPDGVALAAIQGLNNKVEAGHRKSEDGIHKLEAENAELKQRNESLEKRLNVLETIILNQKSTEGE
jgi:hypothetical protein